MKTLIAGLAAGCAGALAFYPGFHVLSYFGVLLFPPVVGLVFGLVRESRAEAWRAALAGLFGVLIGCVLFILRGTIFLKTSIALTSHGVPAQLIVALTNPYAWGLAWVAATPAKMNGAAKTALVSGALCFFLVNLVTLLGPSTTRLNEWRLSGAKGAQLLGTFLPFVLDGLIVGISVKAAETKGSPENA